MSTHPFRNARRAKPTLAHRPGIWEGILGTVYARSPQGEVRYFDYDWDAARTFCGADQEGADLRLYRSSQRTTVGGESIPKGRAVLWVRLP